jgi:transposase-like protein
MEQRIRYALRAKTLNQPFNGLHQTDETYVGGKPRKGSGIKGTQGRSLKIKTPVFGTLHVGGNVYVKVVPDTKARTLVPIINRVAKAGSIIVSDEWLAYTRLHEKYNHITIRHYDGEFARGPFHTNGIENFWSHLKRGLNGTYHKVSRKHLHKHCEEFAFRYNTRELSHHVRFELALGNVNCRLPLKELTGKKK